MNAGKIEVMHGMLSLVDIVSGLEHIQKLKYPCKLCAQKNIWGNSIKCVIMTDS